MDSNSMSLKTTLNKLSSRRAYVKKIKFIDFTTAFFIIESVFNI